MRNLQGTENAREDKLESARIGNCKVMEFEWEMESAMNGISKELQIGICK